MKRLMLAYLGLLIASLLSLGCGAQFEAAQHVDQSREALRTCLASTPNDCAAQAQMLEADQRTYEAATAGGSHGFVQSFASSYHPTPYQQEPAWMQMRDQQQNLQQQMRDQQQQMQEMQRDTQQRMRDMQPTQVEIVP
jgi:hypothetical protein